jgi:hypothetical protein
LTKQELCIEKKPVKVSNSCNTKKRSKNLKKKPMQQEKKKKKVVVGCDPNTQKASILCITVPTFCCK